VQSQKQAVSSYRQVVVVLGDSRDAVLAGFRSRDGLADRWKRADWEAMAKALSHEEDDLEMWVVDHPRQEARYALRRETLKTTRRRIEDQIAA
jgi:hypothetical protein